MVQIHIDRTSPPRKREQDVCKVYGSTQKIVLEICVGIICIYQAIMARDPAGAFQFRLAIGEMLAAGGKAWETPIEQTAIWGVNGPQNGRDKHE